LVLLINRIADSALRVILPKASAGACVPENGHVCKCVAATYCIPGNQTFWEEFRYNCTGQCVYNLGQCGVPC
jgi:hypothetical protein